ncbi:MAG: hypothetical protein B7X72_02540, partial [Sphingobacteriia bacterium 39-39-8]
GAFVLAVTALLALLAVWLTRDNTQRDLYEMSTAQPFSVERIIHAGIVIVITMIGILFNSLFPLNYGLVQLLLHGQEFSVFIVQNTSMREFQNTVFVQSGTF